MAEQRKYKQKVTVLLAETVLGWMLPLTEQWKVKGETPESKEQQKVKFQNPQKTQKFLSDPELHIYWEDYKKLSEN